MSDAYEIAKGGGKPSGWLENARRNMGVNQVRQAISSLQRQIDEHTLWIADPLLKDGMKNLSEPERSRYVLDKWPRDIARQQEQKNIMIGLLKELQNG